MNIDDFTHNLSPGLYAATLSPRVVLRDPADGKLKLWYIVSGESEGSSSYIAYAESDDGIAWNKPTLGLFPYKDIADTNIVLVGNGGCSIRYANSIVVDPAVSGWLQSRAGASPA